MINPETIDLKSLLWLPLVQIKEGNIQPTNEQLQQMYRICASLTSMFVSVHLVSVDKRTGDLIIIAGEETQAAINKQGEVDYRD